MAVADETRTAVGSYHSQVEEVVEALQGLADLIGECRDRLSPEGPMGATADADLDRARTRLDDAHRRLTEAGRAAGRSPEPARRYLERVFPA